TRRPTAARSSSTRTSGPGPPGARRSCSSTWTGSTAAWRPCAAPAAGAGAPAARCSPARWTGGTPRAASPPGSRRRNGAGPLAAVGRLLDLGLVSVVRAADVVSLRRPAGLDAVEREVWEAVRAHVRVLGLADGREPDQVLGAEIDDAAASIRLWSRFDDH